MSPDEVLAVAEAGRQLGCKEALFTLGDRPEARFASHKAALRRFGHETTQSYLAAMCAMVLEKTGLLPHPNAGILGRRELSELREVSASQGMMLESVSERLCGPGGPHEHAPDKRPATRLAMIHRAGELRIPFTSGILIGIGETERERVEALLALRDLHDAHGHIQEVIVQNFRAKPNTPMAAAGEPGLVELMTTCAIARIVMGPAMSIQAPPNLSADYGPLLLSGINDWGGVSPLTPDFVNPEAPWPDIEGLRSLCADAGYELRERLTIYPEYLADDDFLDPGVRPRVRALADEQGLARDVSPEPLVEVAV
jgi:FO synthase